MADPAWTTVNDYESTAWNTIVASPLSVRGDLGSGFSAGAFASGAFDELSSALTVVAVPTTWQNINNAVVTSWGVIDTNL